MRTGTGIATAILAASLVTLVAGCGGGGGNALSPTTTTSAAPSDPLPAYGAPKVTHPLNTTKYEQNPCSVVTAAQLQALNNHGTGKSFTNAVGPACDWTDDATISTIQVTFYSHGAYAIGLTATYMIKDKQYSYFQPTQIAGYPAVLTDSGGTHGDKGSCVVYVGLADDLQAAFQVDLIESSPGYATACTPAQQFANDGMQTMKSGI